MVVNCIHFAYLAHLLLGHLRIKVDKRRNGVKLNPAW